MKRITTVLALLAALVFASVAAASVGCPPKTPPDRGSHAPCVQYNHITHKCHVPGPTVPPVTPPGTITPPVTVVSTPTTPAGATSEGFCVQTKEAGETFVQAYVGAFDKGGAWRALAESGATLSLDKHQRTLLWEGGKGVIVAPNVPGVGLTCAQPYVSTDGVVQNTAWLAGLQPIA